MSVYLKGTTCVTSLWRLRVRATLILRFCGMTGTWREHVYHLFLDVVSLEIRFHGQAETLCTTGFQIL